MKISAVVVTYNRKQLLAECVEALLKQTYPVNEIVILDNVSTDGTTDFLEKIGVLQNDIVKYIRLESNTGGAGGFYYGSKQAYEDGADWIWMMDDDCVATSSALEELVRASERTDASFFHSITLNECGEASNSIGAQDLGTSIALLDQGLLRISYAAFVSFFMNRKAIEKCGLPYKNFFIYGDDAEYSKRLIQYYGSGYLVGKSKVIHKAGSASSPWDSLETARIKRGHYLVRNALINISEYGSFKNKIKKYILNLIFIFQLLLGHRKRRFLKIGQVIQGTFEYWVGNYDRKSFRKRFTNHLDNTEDSRD